jgi:hypothetical protein
MCLLTGLDTLGAEDTKPIVITTSDRTAAEAGCVWGKGIRSRIRQ